ncbi:hypothetical protein [Ferruginibacter sp.]
MKKIFTLLVGITIAASTFAQYKAGGYDKKNDVAFNDGFRKDNDRDSRYYSFSTRERDMQIAQINRDYDWKIQDVKRKMFVSRFRKDVMIRQLEDQRRFEINKVYDKFNDRFNRFDHDPKKHW